MVAGVPPESFPHATQITVLTFCVVLVRSSRLSGGLELTRLVVESVARSENALDSFQYAQKARKCAEDA